MCACLRACAQLSARMPPVCPAGCYVLFVCPALVIGRALLCARGCLRALELPEREETVEQTN
eukprot:15157928-Alexandrium_andersonii.AAC.1